MLVTIIDYGLSNLLSVQRAVEYCGETARIASDPGAFEGSDALILPGVGAFADGMNHLNALGLTGPIRDWVAAGKPFLGICLGMQMMFSSSEEGPGVPGLGIIGGEVVRIPALTAGGMPQRVPHVCWEEVQPADTVRKTFFDGVPDNSAFYFVHSYQGMPADPARTAAVCTYGGRMVTAAVMNEAGNALGCQFHPEKSSHAGLRVLHNFLKTAEK